MKPWFVLILLAPLALDTEGARPLPTGVAAATIVLGGVVSRRAPALGLTAAGVLGIFVVVDGVSPGAPLSAAVLLSLLAGRNMRRLWLAEYAFAGAATIGMTYAVAKGDLTGWIVILVTQFGTAMLPWWAGTWWRQRAELLRAGWERAEQAAKQARLLERARIAQDMHDSLGHELSLMALTAGGLELSPGLSEEQRVMATRLREGSVAATERLHEVIGLLGQGEEPTGDEIPDLVERVRRSGVSVELCEEGGTREWAAPVLRHAARRVVQEALTNAVKHAPGSAISVRVAHSEAESVVAVTNTGSPADAKPGSSPVGSGTGLISLDERVRLAGGTLRARPLESGFEVVARLPRTPPESAATPAERAAGPAELVAARRRVRRDLLRASAVPVGLGVALLVALFTVYTVTVMRTSLGSDEFDRLRLGQERAEFASVLPHSISAPPPVLAEPPIPTGAECEYYRAGHNLLDFSETMFRLCFEDGVLVAKDTLRRGDGWG
ncbi:two-component sensor histidine kinase [Streptomyces sp. 8K308]|uniref:sensor histidine kinase n=1 Tax=Streptomyces sp. 8K308 TaxID=2530388 RepID=UPI001052049E|nr:histidine kinase [Streptomyces sp. 8K308]TDC21572.1 two-component sensor histidine kinase [Streptomyces sp. 8K308]